MGTFPKATHSVASSIAAVRQTWLDAVRAGDAARLAALVTDDVVVVHGNGRCVCGQEALIADFRKGFEAFAIAQQVSNSQIVVRGAWTVEISDVDTRLIPHGGGRTSEVHSTSVVALKRQTDGSWKVGRVLGVMHDPKDAR